MEALLAPLFAAPDLEVDHLRLRPRPPYPFPWDFWSFLDAFPESAQLEPPALEPEELGDSIEYDLIIIGWTVWFLAPAPPITAFLKGAAGRRLLSGKPVVSLVACRNLWTCAFASFRQLLREAGGQLIDHAVLTDPGPVLGTLLTTPRWLLTGRKAGMLGLPPAGLGADAQSRAGRWGAALAEGLAQGLETTGRPLLGGLALDSIQCLACGTCTPDQTMPSHGVMVHGELGTPACEGVTTAANCLAGVTSLKYAWLAMAAGCVDNAVVTGSEICSAMMHARNFEAESSHRVSELERDPGIAFEKDFLRWMLSDGAGAALLERSPRPGQPALAIEWIDLYSFAHLLPACMYAGAERGADGALVGWMNLEAGERAQRSLFAMKQDVKLLNENIIRYCVEEPLRATVARRGLAAEDVDWFLPHLSSSFFREPTRQGMEAAGLPIPEQRWFSNLTTRRNTGAASIFIMLDERVRSGRLRDGQRILCGVPESARFSSAVFSLRVEA